jgi:hypothetical protein
MDREERELPGKMPPARDAKASSRASIDNGIAAQRGDEDFQTRLSKLIETDRRILERLAR